MHLDKFTTLLCPTVQWILLLMNPSAIPFYVLNNTMSKLVCGFPVYL